MHIRAALLVWVEWIINQSFSTYERPGIRRAFLLSASRSVIGFVTYIFYAPGEENSVDHWRLYPFWR